jgi:hypothetical protein
MRGAFDDPDASERPELIAPLRRLIHSVVVHAQPGVKGAFDVETKGRLQELLGAPFLKRAVGGGPLVAGERLEPPISEFLSFVPNSCPAPAADAKADQLVAPTSESASAVAAERAAPLSIRLRVEHRRRHHASAPLLKFADNRFFLISRCTRRAHADF